MLERLFHLRERETTPLTEVRAGVATFLTMAYILFVNPQILSQAGMPVGDVTVATALASAFATVIMGVYANYPFALAPGMGLNAYFTFGVVLGMGVSYQVALAAVFLEGLIFLGLTFGGIRSAVIHAIPPVLKTATMSGIGLFLAIIGFQHAGLMTANPDTLVTLGSVRDASVLLALGGLFVIAALLVRKVPGAILIGIVAVTLTAWATGAAPPPEGLFSVPTLPRQTLIAFDFETLLSAKLIPVVLAFLFVDFFDTAGTLIGVGRLGGFLDADNELPRADRAFAADALGTTAGALLGTSTVTTYIESATGVEEGGRTGLTAIVVAVLFVASLFFIPLITAVPAAATAPALIIVGAFMLQGTAEIPWQRLDDSIPAFLMIVTMPFTYSIAHGISAGIISYVVIKVLTGHGRRVPWVMYVLAVALAAYYGLSAA